MGGTRCLTSHKAPSFLGSSHCDTMQHEAPCLVGVGTFFRFALSVGDVCGRSRDDTVTFASKIHDPMAEGVLPNPITANKKTRSVSFDEIQIRNYNTIVGDHPLCMSGFPLSLGWEVDSTELYSVDYYEKFRLPRRNRHQLRTSSEERERILCKNYAIESSYEIRQARRKLHRVRSTNAKLHEQVKEMFFNEALFSQ